MIFRLQNQADTDKHKHFEAILIAFDFTTKGYQTDTYTSISELSLFKR